MKNTLRIICLCLVAVFGTGCSQQLLLDGAEKATVVVMLDGIPVEDAAVVFTPVGGGRSATGKTNGNGIAQMGTSSVGDGVFPGEYTIGVIKSIEDPDTVSAEETPEEYKGRGAPLYAKQIYLVPKKYISPASSGLSTIIEVGSENRVELELSSK
ncbi:MAG: hypothetical protein WD045_10620 [Pirellulaceae bacterium]